MAILGSCNHDECRLPAAGHTSWSTTGMGYLSLWLAGKLRAFDPRGGQPWRLVVSLMPTSFAVYVGLTRIEVGAATHGTPHSRDILYGTTRVSAARGSTVRRGCGQLHVVATLWMSLPRAVTSYTILLYNTPLQYSSYTILYLVSQSCALLRRTTGTTGATCSRASCWAAPSPTPSTGSSSRRCARALPGRR